MSFQEQLSRVLVDIEANDEQYDARYRLVMEAIYLASECCYPAGFRLDPTEPEWPVAYIELPTGQVSWHLPQHPIAWDGHDTAEKYRRCREYASPTPLADREEDWASDYQGGEYNQPEDE